MNQHKTQLIFVPYGLGKFYIYRKKGEVYRIIEMNRKMFDFNKELFYWVLQHELNHDKFYKNPKNEGKRDVGSEALQQEDREINRRMRIELSKFEIKHLVNSFKNLFCKKRFAIHENPKLLGRNQISYHECDMLDPQHEYKVRLYMEGL